MIRKSAWRLSGKIMLNQKAKRDVRFDRIASRLKKQA